MWRATGVLYLLLASASLACADDPIIDAWAIDGDHAIVGGILVVGGKKTTRAYLKPTIRRGFYIGFQYRLEGKQAAELGWDLRQGGKIIPGVGLRILPPRTDWDDAFLQEYFDWRALQRMVKHHGGANGVPGDVESVWIEVPAGSKLYLRSTRLREGETTLWPWLVVVSLLVGVTALCGWRWKKRRRGGK